MLIGSFKLPAKYQNKIQVETFQHSFLISIAMVFKIAGYVLSFDQVRTWLEKQGREHGHLEDVDMMTYLNRWFEEKKIYQYFRAICTDYPLGEAVIVLARRLKEDPKSTVSYCYRVRETQIDRDLKKQVLEESGLADEVLPWVTIADPFFQG
ncbi:hypothetical protein AZE42_04613 [Rhizopogon vesiculosus]|uniref:Uncharacterized protein n=1 Tax=Rhizopogon vesiculosus TaxID=180088 RepID=A0A1J8R8G0_9AGAM|nr:hypothetical protein AZE42_04613 [Rhizopogon vesiculosus]